MTQCYDVPYMFNPDELYFFVIIITISVILLGFALLDRYQKESSHIYYGLIYIMLLAGVVAVLISIAPVWKCTTSTSGTSVDMEPGVVQVTLHDVANLDSMEFGRPNGTNSIRVEDLHSGARFTLRSNEEVINFLNSPENSIKVPTSSGTKTVESVGELPSEYQNAPDGFVDPDANIGNYDNASVATVACLFKQDTEYEIGYRHVPADVSIPCNTPILAQNVTEVNNATLGTHVKPSSGPNRGKILTSPITLRKGEYHLIGIINGQKTVIQPIDVTDAQSKKNDTVTEEGR